MEHDWLCDDIHKLRQKVRFRDRIEYRISGLLHNLVGPAIIYFDDIDNNENGKEIYYIKGKIISPKDWNILNRSKKIRKLLKRTKKEEN